MTRTARLSIAVRVGLLAALAAAAGCLAPIKGTLALHEAQDDFNDASTVANKRYTDAFADPSTNVVPPETPADKYQRVANLVNQSVLPQVDRDDLKLNALAMLAFSEWQLGHFKEANNAAATGEDLCARAALATNRRDCGMLVITPGLVKHSQAYRRYQDKRQAGFLTPADATDITTAMSQALADIDEINTTLPKDEPIAVYANRQQLLIMNNAMDVWADTQPAQSQHQPLCDWTARADEFWHKRFPERYAIKTTVDALHDNILQIRKAVEKAGPCA